MKKIFNKPIPLWRVQGLGVDGISFESAETPKIGDWYHNGGYRLGAIYKICYVNIDEKTITVDMESEEIDESLVPEYAKI